MKMVVAYIQPFMAEKVVQALHAVPGLSGATFSEVRGFGRGRARGAGQSVPSTTEEELLGTVSRMRIDAMIPDDLEDRVVRSILEAARTGNRGEGKVYVSSIDRAVRISTLEEGERAV